MAPPQASVHAVFSVSLLCILHTVSGARHGFSQSRPRATDGTTQMHTGNAGRSDLTFLHPKYAGYLPVANNTNSEMYYAYFEPQMTSEDVGEAPVVLWLQGGPGCASTFGGFYELGPFSVTSDLRLVDNPGAWNRIFGLLLVDQPVGTGYSYTSDTSSIPTDEMGMATHLYHALQLFFTRHHDLQGRPLFITGESFGGKYVPSIAHYILQAEAEATRRDGLQVAGRQHMNLDHHRQLPPGLERPAFKLSGIAIGNGLSDPRAQTQTLAHAAYYMGMLSPALRDDISGKALQVVQLIDDKKWKEAHTLREELRSMITNATGLATMFDTRRTQEYDPAKAVDTFLNLPDVKEVMRARAEVNYSSCSDVVRDIMSADVMQTVKPLFGDLLQHLRVLLYQGQFDILDGVASSLAWIGTLPWQSQQDFNALRGELWYHNDKVAGWTRELKSLRHTVVYRAGHMVPHDQPGAARQMLEGWVMDVLDASRSNRVA